MENREKGCFKRFIERCQGEYDESWIGMWYNPFKEMDLSILEPMGGLEPEEKQEEVDPLILGHME